VEKLNNTVIKTSISATTLWKSNNYSNNDSFLWPKK